MPATAAASSSALVTSEEDLQYVVGGCIHRIEVKDFKSYGGFRVIGPFGKFTSVIGPNGAGERSFAHPQSVRLHATE